ncbi:hypothetical protein ROJ8625_02089 [Roseivivax jejudonensis]|uniref:Lipoprotein n=1 Tax=Roseivivax jejudonensis TaxID=1529041 RepID=A0A1X6Z7S5_9RHOB|nr:hypothetical protein [Roseivivax jejudonensis]SLN42649.1 hypothetical protein ROJ8625_02089 [Roseivivax jejudonensis]
MAGRYRIAGLAALAALLTLTACAETSKRIRFDGEFYRARATAPRSDRHNFVVSAGPIQRGFEGARQAAFYEGTLHCITHFGSSEIVWAVHPTEDDPSLLTRDGNRIATRGRCIEWPERGS